MRSAATAITLALCVFTSWPVLAQNAVTKPLVDTFQSVCEAQPVGFATARNVLWAAGWKLLKEDKNTDSFVATKFLKPDGSMYASLQHYDFGQGLFEQCEVAANMKIEETDLAAILAHFPSAMGKVVRSAPDQFSGMYLLADQKQFTSLNINSTARFTAVVVMRTTEQP